MKKLILFILISIFLYLAIPLGVNYYKEYAKLHPSDAHTVYNELRKHTGVGYLLPPLFVIDSTDIQAYTDFSAVYISTGMLEFMDNNEDALALVLGHEIGHIMVFSFSDSQIEEANADRYGAYLMMRAGYNICHGRLIMKQFLDQFGDVTLTSASHPPNSSRYEALNFPQCD